MSIVSTFSPAWLILIFFISGGLAFWLYRKDKILDEQPLWVRVFLFLLRFTSLSLIGYFLLEPMIKLVKTVNQKPIVVLAVDNSSSILNGSDSSYYKNQLSLDFEEAALALSDKFQVETFRFDSKVIQGLDLDFSGDETNLSLLNEELETRFYNRNPGALIIATDGNYNVGFNPVYSPDKLQAPVYTLVLGDTGTVKNLSIQSIIHNDIAFLDDEFPVELNLESKGLNKLSFRIKVFNKNQLVFEKNGKINSNRWSQNIEFYLKAIETGVQRYRIVVETGPEDKISIDNKETFYIKIIDERVKVAIITATPHPDIAIWKRAISSNKNYEVTVFNANKFDAKITDYRLFILYQMPETIEQTALLNLIEQAKIPYLLVVGLKTNINLLSQSFNSFNLILESNSAENFKVALNPDFTLFSVDSEISDNLDVFPPISSTLLNVDINQPYQKLFAKKIGTLNTGLPVWVLSENTNPRNGIIIGENIWRWSITSYSIYKTHRVFDDFLLQNVKYLVRKVSNKRFVIELPENLYEGNSVALIGKLFNSSMEPVKGANISLSLSNEKGEQFEYAFIESPAAYKLNLGELNSGDYIFSAKAEFGKETLNEKGKFTIRKKMLEQRDTHANQTLLHQWATATGGRDFYPGQLKTIVETINSQDLPVIIYNTESYVNLVQINKLFFILFALLSIEWFLRRFYGTY